MQEIAKHIYIDNTYLGVTLGAINLSRGLILIDAPPRPEDVRSWRASLYNLGGGADRLLVNLDAHVDRTLGTKAMECIVVAHEKSAQAFRNRPTAFKAQEVETGAEWELINGLGTIRWAPPEITFTSQITIHWDDQPVILEHHPGPHAGAIWVIIPQEHVCFIGDCVMPNQPPFLAGGDLPAWINTLQLLLSPAYMDYLLVGGRTGLVSPAQVTSQLDYLQHLEDRLTWLSNQKAPAEVSETLIPELLAGFHIPDHRRTQYTKRLKWGLYYYYTRHMRVNTSENDQS